MQKSIAITPTTIYFEMHPRILCLLHPCLNRFPTSKKDVYPSCFSVMVASQPIYEDYQWLSCPARRAAQARGASARRGLASTWAQHQGVGNLWRSTPKVNPPNKTLLKRYSAPWIFLFWCFLEAVLKRRGPIAGPAGTLEFREHSGWSPMISTYSYTFVYCNMASSGNSVHTPQSIA